MLEIIKETPECILLIIAPVRAEQEYITNKTLKETEGDLIPNWKKYVYVVA